MATKKGKKGAKNKKNAKGKKKSTAKKKPEAPVKTFAKVQRFKFSNDENFLGYICEMDLSLPMYVLFRSSYLSLQDDIMEDEILKFINYMQQDPYSRDIIFATVYMDPDKLESSPLGLCPKTRLRELPTLLRWGRPGKLQGLQRCSNMDLLCLLFADKKTSPPNDYTRFTDNNKNLCPFLPSPEDVANPPPPPAPEIPPVKVVKMKVNLKKGKGAKGKKGKKGRKKK